MFRSYWIAAIALGLALSLPVVGNGQESPVTDGSSQADSSQQPPQPSPPLITVDIVEDQAETDARAVAEQRAEQRELQDLAAQEGMNEATQRMADYARYQTVLIFVGTVLLFVTLWLTRQANHAAQDAVNVTREHGIIQLRPWISFVNWEMEGIGVEGDLRGFVLILNWRNTGSTPATNLRAFTGLADAPEFREESQIFADDAKGGAPVAPGLPFSTRFNLTPEEILESTETPVRLRSFIQYNTTFDGIANRLTAATFEIIYIGLAGIDQIREGIVGTGNFTFRPLGTDSRMT